MRKESIFKGAATALVTPMNENGVDYENFGKLIDWQIESGIDALVIAGTTGEGSTLSDEEHRQVLEFAAKRANKRVPMIAGTGSNDTAYAIDLTKCACELDYDGMLVVTPYYNKATQKGLVAMYEAIAKASTKPIILYNVPSRTGCGIEPKTYLELAQIDNIVAIKEANGDLAKIVEMASLIGDKLDFYSGNDDQVIPIMAMGGIGVISVLSNVLPKETVSMCAKMLNGDLEGARKMQLEMLPLIKALFSEVNPIPVRCALSHMGFGENYLRLPLTPLEPAHEEVLLNEMRKYNVIG